MESRDARNSCMDMNNNNNNNNQKNMVVGFDGVGGYARENNTMTMMMMPPLSTNTTTSTTTSTCSSTFFFPHHLPPFPHHPSQNHAATSNSNNHHGRLTTSGCLSGVVPSNSSMDQLLFNQTNGNQDSMLNKPSSSNCLMADLDNSNHNESSSSSSMKAKIMAHPHYPRLLAAYINCQKVGAPPEVVGRLEAACAAMSEVGRTAGYVGEDPALDQFMEAYCEMLTKYEQELTKPFNEAMVFLSRIECQFKALTLSSNSNNAPYLFSSSAPQFSPAAVAAASSDACGDGIQGNGLSDEQIDVNTNLIDPQADDDELKYQLLRKYSGSLGSLKQEFMKKRKKGKLPKEARQQLLDWWTNHYKWPYPTETQKIALAESTGLDPKQINNWFINQRKRHWKPSEDMQLVVMDASHPHHQYYMTDNVLGNPFPMDHFYPAFL